MHQSLIAVTRWLDTLQSAATRRAYARALEDLLASCGTLQPEKVARADVLRWVQQMTDRGSAPASIALKLAGVSSFYRFAFSTLDPAAGSPRPAVEPYGRAAWLQPDEATELLRVIERDTLRGKRDFALLLGCILLARGNTAWRTVCWGACEQKRIPLPLWNATCEYLSAAARLKSMTPDQYIFTAIVRTNQPLSSHEVGRLLKKYLKMAGIKGEQITLRSLRHTGAMLRKAAGASDLEIMTFLGHPNLATTKMYLHALSSNQDSHWMRVSDLLEMDVI